MLALLLLASSLPQPFVSSAVEKPVPSFGVSTSLDTNGKRELPSALDAERAFAADAQTLGQWTAFRKWGASDATMFVPQPINAQTWLKDRKDPAKAIDCWPTASYVSSDGSLAVNTGGWKRPDGAVGYFSTVWQRQPDGGWKWIVDGGGDLQTPPDHVAQPVQRVASCSRNPKRGLEILDLTGKTADGESADGTLVWHYIVQPDGLRIFQVGFWDGGRLLTVAYDEVPPAK